MQGGWNLHGCQRGCKTIAKAGTLLILGCDFVYFNKGCTWREQLTVPSSGSAGNVITFGSYGTGAAPIINGYLAKNSTGDWTEATTTVSNGDKVDDAFTGDCTGWTLTGGAAVACTNNRVEIAAAGAAEQSARLAGCRDGKVGLI